MLKLLKIEMLKIKKSSVLNIWIGIVLVSILTSMQVVLDAGEITDSSEILDISLNMSGLFYYPILIILVVAMMIRIENNNNTWKVLLSSGVNKKKIYLAKYLFIVLLIFLGVFLNISSIVLVTMIKYGIYDILSIGIKKIIYTFISSLGFIAIEFLISMLFSSFLIPLTVGVMGIFITLLTIMSGELFLFNPFGYASYICMGIINGKEMAVIIILSIIVVIFVNKLVDVLVICKN